MKETCAIWPLFRALGLHYFDGTGNPQKSLTWQATKQLRELCGSPRKESLSEAKALMLDGQKWRAGSKPKSLVVVFNGF